MTETTLKKLYYDETGGGLDTLQSLYRRAKSEDSSITLAKVRAFLQNEANSQRNTKRPRHRRSYVAFSAPEEFQVDIADMTALMPEGSGSSPQVQRSLELLKPFRDALRAYVRESPGRTLGQIGTFLSHQEGWALAKSQAHVGTLRRALELMGFSVETGKQGGVSRVFEDAKEFVDSEAIPPMALVAVDIFSKMASVQPILSKRPADTAKALDKVVEDMGSPAVVMTDEGGEFEGAFAERLKYYDAQHLFQRPHAYFAERFIRTLKEWLLKRQRALGGTWVENLPAVMRRYNTVVEHAATGMTPEEAAKDDNRERVLENLEKKNPNPKRKVLGLKEGDQVRYLLKPTRRRFDTVDWSRSVHVVESTDSAADGTTLYKISDAPVKRRDGFLRHELLKV
jgi:hypothetical protein